VRATVITYINPAVAAVPGVLVLQETFTVPMAIGVLVIAGSILATRPARTAALRPTPAAARPAITFVLTYGPFTASTSTKRMSGSLASSCGPAAANAAGICPERCA